MILKEIIGKNNTCHKLKIIIIILRIFLLIYLAKSNCMLGNNNAKNVIQLKCFTMNEVNSTFRLSSIIFIIFIIEEIKIQIWIYITVH